MRDQDDFERRLARQPLRTPPPEWRGEILRNARAAISPVKEREMTPASSWWRQLLWPCPQAWVGLAAAWAIVAGLNWLAQDETAPPSDRVAQTSAEVRIVLAEQRRLWKELLGEVPPSREPALPAEDGPRSWRSLNRAFI